MYVMEDFTLKVNQFYMLAMLEPWHNNDWY